MTAATTSTIHSTGAHRRASSHGIEILAVAVLLGIAGYAALFVAPTEKTMGVIQRIFYFHVPSAWTGFVAFFICCFGCIQFLRTRAPKWDWLAVASAELGWRSSLWCL